MRAWIVIPNAISVVRLSLAVAFPFVPAEWRPYCLLAAGLSDFADGYIARRFHLTSWVGGLLDALADKLFALSALLTFTLGPELVWWQAIFLLSRDIAVACMACLAVVRRKWYAFRHMSARPLGKATTAAMFVYFLLLAMGGGHPGWTDAAFGLVAVLSALAAFDYLKVFLHARRIDVASTSCR